MQLFNYMCETTSAHGVLMRFADVSVAAARCHWSHEMSTRDSWDTTFGGFVSGSLSVASRLMEIMHGRRAAGLCHSCQGVQNEAWL